MIKLIKLELKTKNKGYILRAFIPMIVSILIALIIIFILLNAEFLLSDIKSDSIDEKYLLDIIVNDINKNYFSHAKNMSNSIFIIFTSIMCGIYFIKDFVSGKIQELYLYPISREKILLSKILIVVLFSVFGNVLVKLLAVTFTAMTVLEFNFSINFVLEAFIDSFAMAFVGLISIAIGFYRKSVVSTVISGLAISILLCGNIVPNFYLGEIAIIKYGTAILGLLSTIFIINKSKEEDI